MSPMMLRPKDSRNLVMSDFRSTVVPLLKKRQERETKAEQVIQM